MASNSLLKSGSYDTSINQWLTSFDRLKSILSKNENSYLSDRFEEDVFSRFSNFVFPLLRSRSRTGAESISEGELRTILDVESAIRTNIAELKTTLDSKRSSVEKADTTLLYTSFFVQLLLFIGFIVLSRDTSSNSNPSAFEPDSGSELKEKVGIQNKAIEELKGMIEENMRTISLKDQEISTTKKSLSEAQDKVEEYTKELRKVAKNLTKSQNEVKNFAQMIARDLRGPLKTISQLSSEIQSALLDNEEVNQETKERIRELLGQISGMEDIINGILEYASIGQKEVLQKVNTKEMVDELVRFFEPDPDTKIVIHEDLPTLRTDNLALKQVFYNLVSNAVKFTKGPGSKVEIGCIEGPIFYKFWVMDNGPGIPKEDQERIFELFEKSNSADSTTKTAGVGLALVKKILMDKELEIWVNSQPGQGAKFTFTWKKTLS
jgi:signal transduction histidine kinase